MIPRHILMIASEAVPFAKTGGLGDVVGALPLALARLGHHVLVILPRYRGVEGGREAGRMCVGMAGRTFGVTFVERPLAERARVVLVDCPELFDRPGCYGAGGSDYTDNAVRFAVFARAALEFGARDRWPPDIVHAHDWQAGLAPVYLKTRYAAHPVLGRAATVFTIHNLAYQGLFAPGWLSGLDLDWGVFCIEGLEYWGKMSFLKGGVNFSDMVTTVSPRYAREIQSTQYGFGFEGILSRRASRLCGILNGIDVNAWDPRTDRFLPKPYGPDTLADKRESRRVLLESCGLSARSAGPGRPVVGMVSRLVDQKGFDLLGRMTDRLLSLNAVFVLLGTGDPAYERQWLALGAAHPDRVAVRIGFDERMAHLIEAGSDIFLMPSRFEPCGLNQMYSLRYGTVPVVHATGGLDDTIENWDPQTGGGTGFKFGDYTPDALMASLGKAVETFRAPAPWRALQRAGMREDHSWDAAAAEYTSVYEQAIRTRVLD